MQSFRHNLPHQPTSFVGRDTEISKIISLLNSEFCRLLTLFGPGGIGKSRLALRVGEQLVAEKRDCTSTLFPDGITYVALQSVSSVDHIVPSLVKALDWRYYEGRDPTKELLHFLQDKSLLLILDNFEHLLAATPLLRELLEGAPGIKLLITSRVLLNLAEEWLFHVGGMSLPAEDACDGIAGYDAVRLFCERARRVRHDFSLADEQASVVQICRLVEGTPLAIELAATWLRCLPSGVIAAEIQRNLEILHSDQVGVPERHRTMRAVFDQSWRLLDAHEREMLMGLSVFQGGCLQEAALQVVGATLPVLTALVDKSLLRVTAPGRYSIHELQRQYAAERLDEWPEWKNEVYNRHCGYYLELISHPVLRFLTEGSKQLLDTIEADFDNILVAWNWAVAQRRIPKLYRAATGFYWFSWLKSRHREGENALRIAIEALHDGRASDEGQIAYARVLTLHGAMGNWLGLTDATKRQLQESVKMLRVLPGARGDLGLAIGCLGWAAVIESHLETAKTLLREAAALDEETEQVAVLGFIYCQLGAVANRQSDYQESEHWYQKALKLGRKTGDYRTIADALHFLGMHATRRGAYATAHLHLEESLAISNKYVLSAFAVSALRSLGQLAEIIGDLEVASDYFQRGLEVARLWGKEPTIAQSLLSLAHVRTIQENYEEAKALYREAAAIVSAIHSHTHQSEYAVGMGDFALSTGAYANARRYYQDYLFLARQSKDRLGIARASARLATVSIKEGALIQARRYALAALHEGLATGFLPILAEGVVVAAELYAADGDLPYANELAAVVRDHAASAAEVKRRARTLLQEMAKGFADKPQAANPARSDGGDLVIVAAMLVKRLSAADATPDKARISEEMTTVEPLSERELQILRLVAAGQSNRQISRELSITLGTVKSHLHHINRKMDVVRRTQAVARARELRLF